MAFGTPALSRIEAKDILEEGKLRPLSPSKFTLFADLLAEDLNNLGGASVAEFVVGAGITVNAASPMKPITIFSGVDEDALVTIAADHPAGWFFIKNDSGEHLDLQDADENVVLGINDTEVAVFVIGLKDDNSKVYFGFAS